MATETTMQSADPPAPELGKRRKRPILPIVVLVAIVGGLLFLYAFRSQPAQQVRRQIDKQLKLLAGGRFDQLWEDTFSPAMKKACPLDAFSGSLDQIRASQPDYWTLIEYRDFHITVTGNRAVVTYVITYNGAPIESATPQNPDLYMRATATAYGDIVTKAEQLQQLEQLREQAIVVGKEYEKEKADIMRHGDIRRVLSVKGQWYDEVDGHVTCGG
jgi:hypothetical protein